MSRNEKPDPSLDISGKKQIISMRNRVIHGYDKINNGIIWGTIVRHLPNLKLEVGNLLKYLSKAWNRTQVCTKELID